MTRKGFFPAIPVIPLIATGLILLVAGLYYRTLAPSIGSMDSGELAAVAATLGIAHPTGYPLFTLSGWIVSHLPGDARVIWKLNLFSAVLCVLALILFYKLFIYLLTKKTSTQQEVRAADRAAAAVATLVLAFSRTFWSQAVSVEVYALHLVFIAALIGIFLRAQGRSETSQASRFLWPWFALLAGLSFSNHMTTILLAPGLLFLFLRRRGWKDFVGRDISGRSGIGRIALTAAAFLLGLSFYLYLPLRAAQDPTLNWGDPSTVGRLWDHVTGSQFRSWMFSSLVGAGMQLGRFVVRFPVEFGFLPLLLMAAGLRDLYRRDREMLTFTLLLFCGCVLYAINYGISDIDAYFLLAYAAAAIWIAFGARALMTAAQLTRRRAVTALVCLASVVAPMTLNFRAVDQSGNYAQEDYAVNLLNSLAPGAVILADEETSFYFTAYYLQWVEGVRPDVVVLGYRALGMPWYLHQMERAHPEIVSHSRKEIDEYVRERKAFEGGAENREAMATSFIAMIRSLLRESSARRPVYVTATVPPAYAEGYALAPEGLALRLVVGLNPSPASVAKSLPHFAFRPLPATQEGSGIASAYAWAYMNHAAYRLHGGDTIAGKTLLRKALQVDPGFPDARAWLQRLP